MQSNTRIRIEAAIDAAPDDPAAYGALADLLTESGDPRGEFVATQLALESANLAPPERQRLAAREAACLQEHEREWLGPLAEYLLDHRDGPRSDYERQRGRHYAHRWRRGHLESVQFPNVTLRACRWLARAPEAARLRELALIRDCYEDGYTYDDDDVPQDGVDDLPDGVESDFAGMWALLDAPFLRTLRVVQLGRTEREDYADAYRSFDCHLRGPHVADMVERMPAVEELRLLVHEADLGRVFAARNLTNLRVLQVYHADD